jgi:hypothetical protein
MTAPAPSLPTPARAGAALRDSYSRSIDDLDHAICRLALRINASSYRLLVLVREFDDRMGWAKSCHQNCADWFAWRCGLSVSAAREKVRTAHALRDLPRISAAFARGRLSYSKARALTRVAGSLCDEEPLLAYALDATAAQVEERCRQIRNCAPESAAEAQEAWERRSLSILRQPGRGTMTISVELPIEHGELVARAIDRAVEMGEVENGPEFRTTGWHAQQADALVALAKCYLGGVSGASADSKHTNGAQASMPAADHYQVVVHVDAAALSGGAGRSDLPVETVRRLTCDGSLVTIVEDAEGAPLDAGRKRRTVSTSLRRALWSRDRGCTFPGCHHRRYVEAHHLHHWIDGGETTLGNTTLLCGYHHRLIHEGAFRMRRDHVGALYFQRPDGGVIPRGGYRADDVLDDPSDDLLDAQRLAAIVHGRKPSAEVREASGVYRLTKRVPAGRCADPDQEQLRTGRDAEPRSRQPGRRARSSRRADRCCRR